MKRAVAIGCITAVVCVSLLFLAEFSPALGLVRPLLQVASFPGLILADVPPFNRFGWPSYVSVVIVFLGDAVFYSALWWVVLRLIRRRT